jgi:hypothetical protein
MSQPKRRPLSDDDDDDDDDDSEQFGSRHDSDATFDVGSDGGADVRKDSPALTSGVKEPSVRRLRSRLKPQGGAGEREGAEEEESKARRSAAKKKRPRGDGCPPWDGSGSVSTPTLAAPSSSVPLQAARRPSATRPLSPPNLAPVLPRNHPPGAVKRGSGSGGRRPAAGAGAPGLIHYRPPPIQASTRVLCPAPDRAKDLALARLLPTGVPGNCSAFHAVPRDDKCPWLRPLSPPEPPPGGHAVAFREPFAGAVPGGAGGSLDYVVRLGASARRVLDTAHVPAATVRACDEVLQDFEGSAVYTEYLRQRRRGVRALGVAMDQAVATFIGHLFDADAKKGGSNGRTGLDRAANLVVALRSCNPGMSLDYADAALRGWKARAVAGLAC